MTHALDSSEIDPTRKTIGVVLRDEDAECRVERTRKVTLTRREVRAATERFYTAPRYNGNRHATKNLAFIIMTWAQFALG